MYWNVNESNFIEFFFVIADIGVYFADEYDGQNKIKHFDNFLSNEKLFNHLACNAAAVHSTRIGPNFEFVCRIHWPFWYFPRLFILDCSRTVSIAKFICICLGIIRFCWISLSTSTSLLLFSSLTLLCLFFLFTREKREIGNS